MQDAPMQQINKQRAWQQNVAHASSIVHNCPTKNARYFFNSAAYLSMRLANSRTANRMASLESAYL